VRAGPNSKLGHIANPTSLGAPVQPRSRTACRHCGTRIAPDRDITGSWRDVDEPCASLPAVPPGRAPRTPRQLPAFRYRKEKSRERRTVCWREMDSNFRFRVRCKRGLRRKSPASAACRRRLSGAAGSVRDEGSVPRFRFAPELMATDGGTFPIMASTRWSKVRLF